MRHSYHMIHHLANVEGNGYIFHYILEFSESEVKEYGRGTQKEVPALCSEERLT